MKKKVVIGLLSATMLSSMPLNVGAIGNASINFRSSDTVSVGDNIKVYMSLENIEDASSGIVGVEGKLIFDTEKLEFIEAKTLDTPYDFWFNPDSNKLVGLDFTFENAISKDTNIYEFTFKALEEGATAVTLTDAELSDSKTNILNSNVYGKNITITEAKEVKDETKEITTIKEVTKKTAKQDKTEIKEETNKEKLNKMNVVVHGLLKKLTNLF